MVKYLEKISEQSKLSESEILDKIRELNKHLDIVEIIITDLEKMQPVYTKEAHEEIISKYQTMHNLAYEERKNYREKLKGFH